VRPRRRFSQHFLQPAWVDKLVDAVRPDRADVFLEIGPGTGRLTLPLAERAACVVGVEIDRDLVARLTRQAPANVTLVCGDALEADLAGLLRAACEAGTAETGASRRARIVGNLPYHICSPILFRLLALQSELPCADATLMLQLEVANRLAASPGSSDYGVLGILVQLHATVVKLLTLPPGAFRPSPAVTSAVVRLTFHPPAVMLSDPALFERLVRSVFMQRRKMLANALGHFAGGTPLSAREALVRAGLDPRRRPETLEMTELAALAEVFATATP
jgi:16S rRNA (adenine1518-N6/adenine1519-N6)-dimethyltransferase